MSSLPPPVTHLADRTVVVSGARQGSGVLLTDRLVLTCAHVVKTGSVLIAHPALPDRVRATVTWIDYRLDVALLEATEPVRAVPPVRLGVLDTREAIPGCEITGFPRVQRYGGARRKRLEVDQYTVTVLPMAGRVRDLLVCDLDAPPAAGPDDEPPALSGLSGGPVFAGDILMGIARQVPQQREGRRVECVPLGPVLTAEPFVQAYRRTGVLLREERVQGNFPRDLRYEAEYARALGVAYRRTKIFGLDELSRHDSEWDLDTAYLSLEAQAQDRAARGRGAPEQALPLPQRVDTLLTDRPRVLLRGEAGAGKTTLLWWLAAHASARTLGDGLAPLNGLVPFSLECMGSISFDGLEAWESLTTLALLPYSGVDTALAGLAKAPQITALEAYAFPWEEADRLTPAPSIQALSLDAPPRNSRDLMRLRRIFPALTELELHVQPTQTELDLTPLAEWAGLQVTIEGLAPEKLLGADQLGGRLHTS